MDRESRILATASLVLEEGLSESFYFEVFPEDTPEMQREVLGFLRYLAGDELPILWISQVGISGDGLPICLVSDESPEVTKRRATLRGALKILSMAACFVSAFFLYSWWRKR